MWMICEGHTRQGKDKGKDRKKPKPVLPRKVLILTTTKMQMESVQIRRYLLQVSALAVEAGNHRVEKHHTQANSFTIIP